MTEKTVLNLSENVKYRYPKLRDFLEEFVSGFSPQRPERRGVDSPIEGLIP